MDVPEAPLLILCSKSKLAASCKCASMEVQHESRVAQHNHAMQLLWMIAWPLVFQGMPGLCPYSVAKCPGHCVPHCESHAGLWVMGQLSFLDCMALTICIALGAILGSFGVYVYHLPHFKTLPEPAPVNAEDALLRSRDAISRNALKYVDLLTPLWLSLSESYMYGSSL